MPAPVQITAEQLLREAKERELELVQPVSRVIFLSKSCGISCLSFLKCFAVTCNMPNLV